ncbi:MAG: butyrate kinase [Acidobacteriota bacterium]|jgi:butyrate kinase|nr:butyrate kinase [Acidobacteriota bacterium]
MENKYILAINPGSTSTKIAIFLGEEKVLGQNISHTAEELAPFPRIIDQHHFRQKVILTFFKEHAFDVNRLAAVVGRGGLLGPMASGTYLVSDEMTDYLKQTRTEHASNLGALLASDIAKPVGINAYIVDPVTVDEMTDMARITGRPEIPRISIFHALNQKAAAREAAKKLGKPYENCRLIVAHLGGGISVGAHLDGKVVDVNNALNGDGPFAPERAGGLPSWSLVELATSGQYDLPALKKMITGQGGIVAHLKVNDMRKVEEMVAAGDAKATMVFEAMAYNVAKEIGGLAAALEGKIDAVVLTGGIAFDTHFVELIRRRVEFLARLIVLPGEDEMTALAQGALRVLLGEEKAKQWKHAGGNA